MDKGKIELTKSQFLALLKTVYLGNWMANSHRDGSAEDPHKKDYEDIENFIFSHAKQFGFDRYVDEESSVEGTYYPTSYFEAETGVHELHDDYDDETFWDEIIDRLAIRDLYRKHSEQEILKMSREEYFTRLHELIDKWDDEVTENGIERFDVTE